MSTATFSVDGLHCPGCAETVKNAISSIPDVRTVTVDLQIRGTSVVTVDAGHELEPAEIQNALDTGGNFTVI